MFLYLAEKVEILSTKKCYFAQDSYILTICVKFPGCCVKLYHLTEKKKDWKQSLMAYINNAMVNMGYMLQYA